MPSKAEKKAKKKNQAKQSQNRKYKTLIKNQFKKVDDYLAGKLKEKKDEKELVYETQKVLDKASQKRIIHRNKSRRQKSQLYSKINQLKKEEFSVR